MIRLVFTCPTTGRPLAAGLPFTAAPSSRQPLLSLHCTKCGQLHRFRREDASLELVRPAPATAAVI